VPAQRLQKFLARCGIASRRKSEELIKQGGVLVNGKVVTEIGIKIDTKKDVVEVGGKPVKPQSYIYILLNKPPGYVSAVADERYETVLDIVGIKEKVFPVGRLDKDSRGLLLLTNDGDLAYRLTHPKFEHEKKYLVEVRRIAAKSDIEKLVKGVMLEDGLAKAISAKLVKQKDDSSWIEITIGEGRKRQIKRMCQAIGFEVEDLMRISFGPLELAGLKQGHFRHLTQKEIKILQELY
jgi:23S rRNA pseudouridine2605 synthase